MKVTDIKYKRSMGTTFTILEDDKEYRGMISLHYWHPEKAEVYINGQDTDERARQLRDELQRLWDEQLEKAMNKK